MNGANLVYDYGGVVNFLSLIATEFVTRGLQALQCSTNHRTLIVEAGSVAAKNCPTAPIYSYIRVFLYGYVLRTVTYIEEDPASKY